jgi:putative flippase GtrA
MGIVVKMIRYGAVGVVNSIVGFAIVVSVLQFMPDRPLVANALGFGIGFFLSYFLNKNWTFGDLRPFRTAVLPYSVLLAFCYMANVLVVFVLSRISALGILLPQVMGVATYTLLAFCGGHLFVFKAR